MMAVNRTISSKNEKEPSMKFASHKIRTRIMVVALLPVLIIVGLIFAKKGSTTSQVVNELDSKARENVQRIAMDIYSFCEIQQGSLNGEKIDKKDTPALRKAIASIRVGETGYAYVLAGKGEGRGKYIISKDGARDGEDIWNATDADGNFPIQEICRKGIGLKPGETAFVRYKWKNQGENQARWKITAVTYFAPWDWVIGVGAYEDELKKTDQRVADTMNNLVWTLVLGGTFALVMAVIVGLVVSTKISKSLKNLALVADQLALGDVGATVDISGKDEIGDLARSMNTMLENIKNQSEVAERIAAGDLSVEVKARSERDTLANSMAMVLNTLRNVINEIRGLTDAATKGKLEIRSEADRYQGAYGEIVDGINRTLDAIIAPLNEATSVLQAIAGRDLSARMRGRYQGDLERLKTAINQAVQNLDEALKQVSLSVEQAATAADQISVGSQSLSQSASEQACSLEQISSRLTELSSMTRQNATSAKDAQVLADGAQADTGKGVDCMKRLSSAIEQIQQSSNKTAEIVKTIDEIAFQTNLLALNAAVEAARAGDAGKGFAVVAEEVRNLAMRSAHAAKDTANMIEESMRNADAGVKLNEEMLANLGEINAQVAKVTKVVSNIAVATVQQSEGVKEIASSVEQMNQITQETAANSEESASASEELSTQASEIRNMVGSFGLSAARTTAFSGAECSFPGSIDGYANLEGRMGSNRNPSAHPVI
jgi:methyl-accepting chemotaxis protein